MHSVLKYHGPIAIDFQGGQHGMFLEWVCNRFLAGTETEDDPFTETGAAHNLNYKTSKVFHAQHYFGYGPQRFTPKLGPIISVRITADDLLPLTAVALLRAGDYGIDNNKLHRYTYYKLRNYKYSWLLDLLNKKYLQYQIDLSYNQWKKPDWPDIHSLSDYKNLPKSIQRECQRYLFELKELSEDDPDCPRHILIDLFKSYFQHPDQTEFMRIQSQKMVYTADNDVYLFPFTAFYSCSSFCSEILKIAAWTGHQIKNLDAVSEVHDKFLSRQPYRHHKIVCDQIFNDIIEKKITVCPKIDLLQESYLLARLESYYNHTNITDIGFYITQTL